MSTTTSLPALPEVGRPESYYLELARQAKQSHDRHARAAAKVGQYVTVASNPKLTWEEKLEYYQHCLRRHCVPPPCPNDETWLFYQELANLVRQHAGHAAIQLAHGTDEHLMSRLLMGYRRDDVERDADRFFARFIPDGKRPDWFNEIDYDILTMIRNQWV